VVAPVTSARRGLSIADLREGMTVDEATYRWLALEDRHGHWELHAGRLLRKPGMTAKHAEAIERLHWRIRAQLPEGDYTLRAEAARLRRPEGSYYEADLTVVPRQYLRDFIEQHPAELEVYERPMPFVVEVWSPSTGVYDMNTKIPGYKQRGDAEIWRLHPLERSVTIWRRQPDGTYNEPDGTYNESVVHGGVVELAALPGVRITIDELFEY
jgi:Uma2 family endonuclease